MATKEKSEIPLKLPTNKRKQSTSNDLEVKSGLSMSVNDIDMIAASNHGNGMIIR